MKFQHTHIFNLDGAIRGMRNPLESWEKSDSAHNDTGFFVIGANDKKLAQKLIRAGSDHAKFMRQIMISVDITAPLYWWKEFDTYKVGTVANSTSTMHKLASTQITPECFVFDSVDNDTQKAICDNLEQLRAKYAETKDKQYWRALVQLLPSAWLQTRTITMSYQNIRAMYFARHNHKLVEWSECFMEWARTLPYAEDFILLQ